MERTELLVLITGHIVNEQSKVEEMIQRYNDAVNALNEFDSIEDDTGSKPMVFE